MNKHEVGEILSQKSESERRLSDNRSHDMTLGQLVNSRNLILWTAVRQRKVREEDVAAGSIRPLTYHVYFCVTARQFFILFL